MRCREARRALDAALEHELVLERRFQLEEHLAGCAACAARAARSRRLQELLEGPGDPAPVRADVEAAVTTVLARLARGEGEPVRLPEPRTRVPRVLVAAAALALVALLAWRFGASSPSTPAVAPVPRAASVADAVASVRAPSPAAEAWAEAEVERAVRTAVQELFANEAVAPDARAEFQARLREPARAGWPLRRFVEGLVERPDAATATAALRCLAALADPNALPTLERALGRAELVPAVFAALEALGPASFGALERALGEPRLAAQALAVVCRLGGERASTLVARAARAAGPHATPSRATLLDALTTTGPAAVESLLALGLEAREPTERAALLARLSLVRGAGPALARALERVAVPEPLHFQAVLALLPYEALPWLEQRCANHRERPAALEVLAAYPGTAPLEVLLRLARGGRVARSELAALLDGLLEREAGRAAVFSQALVARASALELHEWLTLLLEGAHPGAAAALVPLCAAPALVSEDREWAALGVLELGGPAEARELAAALAPDPRLERRLAAAVVLALHAHLGPEGVQSWLAAAAPGSLRRLQEALDSGAQGAAAVRLHRVARALEPALLETSLAARHEP